MLLDVMATASTQPLQAVNIYFLAAFAGVAAGAVMIWQWIRDRHKKYIDATVASTINAALDGFSRSLLEKLEHVINEKVDAAYHRVKEDFLDPLDRRVVALETKVDLFWQRISVDMAKVLHHPEPSRQRVDELLEVLMAGTLTEEEAQELRGYLEIIRDWEPGDHAPFAVFQGEQVAAAILLHTMEHVVESKG